MRKAIAYCRVSTKRQQRSGLGIETQRSAIVQFAQAQGTTNRRILSQVALLRTTRLCCGQSLNTDKRSSICFAVDRELEAFIIA
jgi:hypothetical protein